MEKEIIDIKLKEKYYQFRVNMPLELKIDYTRNRIKTFYKQLNGNVYISFSGGKDSTVLLDIARSIYPNIQAIFIDTGLEYPDIRSFVKSINNVIWLKPKIHFWEVLEEYGYPVISKEVSQKIYEIRNTKSEILRNKRINGDVKGNGKLPEKYKFLIDAPFKISHKCCDVIKKSPIKKFERERGLFPIVGTMASDSYLRKTNYLRNGCNSFKERSISQPLSFWREGDIWEYIKSKGIKYSPVYNKGIERTGCMFCMFGVHIEKHNKFKLMEINYPEIYKYCMEDLGIEKVLNYCHIKHTNNCNQLELF